MSGMKPSIYSRKRREIDNAKWHRGGTAISYKRNAGPNSADAEGSTLSFSYTFEHASDCVYFAHCYPYGYSKLCNWLRKIGEKAENRGILLVKKLCYTATCNKCPCCVISEDVDKEPEETRARFWTGDDRGNCGDTSEEEAKSAQNAADGARKKQRIVITARVHPGESNSSFVAQGLIEFLLSQDYRAKKLRSMFAFYIIPMLNPDGVVYGNYRGSLAGTDLNRVWTNPSRALHPTVYYAKQLIKDLAQTGDVVSYCDFHGHSTNKDVFLLGCPADSPEKNRRIRLFGRLLARFSRCFSVSQSKFVIERDKLSTGRIVVFRELGVLQSYTLEASCFGSDGLLCQSENDDEPLSLLDRKKRDCHFVPEDLTKIGQAIALAYLAQGTIDSREGAATDRRELDKIVALYKRIQATPLRAAKSLNLSGKPDAIGGMKTSSAKKELTTIAGGGKSRNRLDPELRTNASQILPATVNCRKNQKSAANPTVVELVDPEPPQCLPSDQPSLAHCFPFYRRINNILLNHREMLPDPSPTNPRGFRVVRETTKMRSMVGGHSWGNNRYGKQSLDPTQREQECSFPEIQQQQRGREELGISRNVTTISAAPREQQNPSINTQHEKHRTRISFDKYVRQFNPKVLNVKYKYVFTRNVGAGKTDSAPDKQSVRLKKRNKGLATQENDYNLSTTLDVAEPSVFEQTESAMGIYKSIKWNLRSNPKQRRRRSRPRTIPMGELLASGTQDRRLEASGLACSSISPAANIVR